jgi:hypothetical protein
MTNECLTYSTIALSSFVIDVCASVFVICVESVINYSEPPKRPLGFLHPKDCVDYALTLTHQRQPQQTYAATISA